MKREKIKVYLLRIYDLQDKPILLKVGCTANTVESRLLTVCEPLRKEIIFKREHKKARDLESNAVYHCASHGISVGREWFHHSEEAEKKIIAILSQEKIKNDRQGR